jgi:TPR repeat protein
MNRHSKNITLRDAWLSALGLLLLPLAPATWASDHLPPGVEVIYVRPPAYLDKLPGNTVYTDADVDQATELAKIGDAEAEANLGVMLSSRGDYKNAALWYKRAADVGIATAAYNLGTLYFNGQGFPQDYTAARHWFELAAKRNDPYAEFQLGSMYDSGKGVDKDVKQEMYWYNKAARQGLAAAQYNLAVIYHNAEGVDQDDVQAYAWLLLAQRGGVDIAEAKGVITQDMTADQQRAAETLSRTLYVVPDASVRN